ncbi:MAG: Spy/CpxP family protein refolding chaperone [Acidobacteria bacterium]|nr:Spy/CpxP family protein refolding chaperone [Acidobacteriota bacterium]
MTRARLTTIIFFALCLAVAAGQASAQTRGRARSAKPAAAPQNAAATDAPAYPLSEEQKRAIRSILAKAKLEAAPLALLGAQAAKAFDENILAEAPAAAEDERTTKQLLDSLAGVANLRLQTIRDVVALLTPEQKRLLRAEMSKPDTPTSLLDVLSRVFKLPQE